MPKKVRADGDGTFRTMPNGQTLEYTVSYGKDEYGKRIRKRFYGKNPAECRRLARAYERSLGSQKQAIVEYTLGAWLDRWLESYHGKRIQSGQKQIQKSTIDEYKRIAARVKKYKIASVKLTVVKPIMVSDFLSDDLGKYSHTVIKKTRFLLNAAFQAAIDNDYCYKNPVRSAAIPQKPPGEKQAYSDDDIKVIEEYAAQDNDFGVSMLLLLNAGIRSGELRALSPNDIEGRVVHVTKAIKETGKQGLTKTNRARNVPLPENIVALITPRLHKGDAYILGGEHYVVRDTLRSKYEAFFNRLNARLAEQNKKPIKRLPPHCCRHTYSTRMQRAGVPLPIVAVLMGHANMAITEQYTHLDSLPDLISAVDRLTPPQDSR